MYASTQIVFFIYKVAVYRISWRDPVITENPENPLLYLHTLKVTDELRADPSFIQFIGTFKG